MRKCLHRCLTTAFAVMFVIYGQVKADITVSGSWSGHQVNLAIASGFKKITPTKVVVAGADNTMGFKDLASGKIDVLIYSPQAGKSEEQAMLEFFAKDKPLPTRYEIGQFAVFIVVNKKNPVPGLSVEQLKGILTGKITDWREVSGTPGKIRILGEARGSKSRDILANHVMENKAFAASLEVSKDSFLISAAVAQDPNALGFYLYRQVPPETVKVLGLRSGPTEPYVSPNDEGVFERKYLLLEPLLLYLSADAGLDAKRYCEVASGTEMAAIVKRWYLYPETERKEYLAKKRISDARGGTGIRIMQVGTETGKRIMPDLTTEYVKARSMIQSLYLPCASDVAAVGAFVAVGDIPIRAASRAATSPTSALSTSSMPASVPAVTPFVAAGGRELLVLDDRLSEQAMVAHGARWNALGRDENGKPNGSGPTEYVPAGRAVAVIVNAANKAEALTLDQIKSIFSGEAGSWKMVGGAGVANGSGKINCFGLGVNDPSTVLFGKEALAVSKFKGVTIKKDAAEVIAAVSVDTDAIGFVDLTAIPTTGQTVKVLAIQLGTGEKARIIQPTAQNIRNSMYPLSSRIFLYVHPNASDTARDFAKFIATCGASTSLSTSGNESSPYADTVKSMMETYRKNGLVPLSDAAITRAARDAMTAAKVKEADTAQAKPK